MEQWTELRREDFVRGVSIKELVRRTGLSRGRQHDVLQALLPASVQVRQKSDYEGADRDRWADKGAYAHSDRP